MIAKICSNRPKMTYFIHFKVELYFGMLLEQQEIESGIYFPKEKIIYYERATNRENLNH